MVARAATNIRPSVDVVDERAYDQNPNVRGEGAVGSGDESRRRMTRIEMHRCAVGRARRRRVAVAGLFAFIAAANTAAAQEGPPPTPVLVETVEKRMLEDRTPVTGEVRAADRTTVASDVEGRVLEVLVDEGVSVAAGAPLARLEDVSVRLRIRQVEARRQVASARHAVREAELARARLDLDRLERLAADRASRPRELDDARTAVAVAEARIAEALADLSVVDADAALLADELDDTVIRAPFAGIIVERHVDPGRWLDRGGPVVELVGIDRYEIWLDVPQRFAAMLADPEATVGVRVPAADRSWEPARPVIVPLVDRDARSFPIHLTVDDTGGVLADGMSAAGSVPAGRTAEHLVVPRDAVLQNAAGFFVYAVRAIGEGPSVAMPVSVRIRFDVGRHVAIDAALGPGESVVVEGNERLFPMMPVAPTPRPDSATASRTDRAAVANRAS